MSERFKYYFPSQVIKDNKTGQRYYGNKPLAELLNKLSEENERLIKDDFEMSYTEKPGHFDKDKLYVKDTHTKIYLNGRNLFIEIYIPQIDQFYRFKYTITGKSLMREFIENYNPKGE